MSHYALLLSLGLFAALAACNTVEGAGEDVSATGRMITEGADEVEDEL